MSITKLSPNWACQMGPIHFINFFAVWVEWTYTYTRTHTAGHRQLASRQIAICKLDSPEVDIMVFHRCYKFSFHEIFRKACYDCFIKIGLKPANSIDYFDCN